MLKSEELSNPQSCLNTAESDEPLFVLKGRDKHAPALVWLWAVLRELDSEKPEIVANARECCVRMMLWAKDHGRQSVGNGQAVLAGVLELIRCANFAAEKETLNAPTNVDFVRMILNQTKFQAEQPKEPDQ